MLLALDIPDDFKALCSGWAGESGCRFRAIESTGGLTLGTDRPWNNDAFDRHLTDEEWHLSLFADLASDCRYYARMAEKSQHPDAPDLRRFETWAETQVETLRTVYGLNESEAV